MQASPATDTANLKPDQYVAVKAGKTKWYAGQILLLDSLDGTGGNEAYVKFLKKVTGNLKILY